MDEQINLISSQKANSTLTRNFSFGLIAILSFLLPIFFIPAQSLSFLAGKNTLLITFVFGLVIAWLFGRLKNKDFSLSKNLFVISAVLVPFSYLLSSLFSGSIRASIFGFNFGVNSFVMVLAFFLLMFLAARLFIEKKKVLYLYAGLLFSSIFMLFFQVLRLIFGPDFLSFGVLNTTSSNLIGAWSDFGVFFGLISVISLLTIVFMRDNKAIKMVGYATLVGSLFFVALVNVLSVWFVLFSAALALIIYNFITNKKKEHETKKKNTSIASWVVLVISLFFVVTISVGGSIGNFLPSMFNIQNSEVRPSVGSTIDIIQASLASDPIFGKGLDGFSKQWSMSRPVGINNTQFWNLDFNTGANFVLSSLVTVGLFGFFSWVLFFGLIIYFGLKLLKGLSRRNQFDHYVTLSVFFATIYLWFFSFISTPGVVIFALSFLFTGVLLSLLYQEKIVKVKKFSLANKTGKSIVLIIVVIGLFLVSAFSYYLFVKKVSSSMKVQKSLIVLNAENDIDKSLELMVGAAEGSKNDLYYRLLSEMNLLKLQSVLAQEDVAEEVLAEQFQTIFANARVNAEIAVSIDSKNYQNWLALGKVYGSVVPLKIEGSYDEAIKYYGEAINLSPTNPSLALTLANLEIANEDIEKAKGYIGSAIQLKNNYTEAYYLLAQIESAAGNEEEAVKIIEALAVQTPNDPEVQLQLGFFKYNKQNYEEAIPYFEKALELNPVFADAAYLLGLSYNGVGKTEEAINLFTSLQQAIPEDENIGAILENIKAGREPLFGLEQQQ